MSSSCVWVSEARHPTGGTLETMGQSSRRPHRCPSRQLGTTGDRNIVSWSHESGFQLQHSDGRSEFAVNTRDPPWLVSKVQGAAAGVMDFLGTLWVSQHQWSITEVLQPP